MNYENPLTEELIMDAESGSMSRIANGKPETSNGEPGGTLNPETKTKRTTNRPTNGSLTGNAKTRTVCSKRAQVRLDTHTVNIST